MLCLNLGSLVHNAGNAVADILFGDAVPAGKLTTSFPLSEGQIPNYYNYKRSGRPGDMPHSSTVRHIDVPNRTSILRLWLELYEVLLW